MPTLFTILNRPSTLAAFSLQSAGTLANLLMVMAVLSVLCWNDVTVTVFTYYWLSIANIWSGQPTQKVLYNCSSWEVLKSVFSHPDKCHQRHPRSILGWPLSDTVREACWRHAGTCIAHAIRHTSQLAMQFVLEGATEYKGRHSRHQTNFLETIWADLSRHQLKLQCKVDIKTQKDT